MSHLHEAERPSNRRMFVVRYFVIAATTLLVSCEVLEQLLSELNVDCWTMDGLATDIDNDGDFDKTVACASDDTTATGKVTDGGVETTVVAPGAPSSARVVTSLEKCYEVTKNSFVGASRNYTVKFDRESCLDGLGLSFVDLSLSLAKNGGAPLVVDEGRASIGCADTSVNNGDQAFEQCVENLPNFRYFCSTSGFLTDLVEVKVGDKVVARFRVEVSNTFESGSESTFPSETEANLSFGLSGAMTQVRCTSLEVCATNADCPNLCLDEACRTPRFAVGANPTLFTTPTQLTSGQAFSFGASARQTTGNLLPHEIVVNIDSAAVDLNGPLTPGLTLGACSLDPGNFTRPILVSSTANTFFVDLGLDGVQDATDPVGVIEDDGSDFKATITVPRISRLTVPVTTKVACSLNTAFIAGPDGIYPMDVVATSIDLDTGGEDDNAGFDPIRVSRRFNLRIGDVGPTTTTTSTTTTTTTTTTSSSSTTTTTVPVIAACGDPVALTAGARLPGGGDAVVTAADALLILRAAVGSATCADCVCDVDGSGAVTATDALLTLKKAVGQAVELTCPACD